MSIIIASVAGAEGNGEGLPSLDDGRTVTLLQASDQVTDPDFSNQGLHELILTLFGIHIDATFVPTGQLHENVAHLLASGDIPHIISGVRHVPINLLNQWGTDGVLYPVDELMRDAPELARFYEDYPYALQSHTAPDGHVYYIPGGYDTPIYNATVVRRDLLDSVNFDLEDVQDFGDYREMHQALKDANHGMPVIGALRSLSNLLETPFNALGLDGPSTLSFDDQSDSFFFPFTSDKAYFAVDWLRELYAAGIIHPDALTSPTRSSKHYFDNYPSLLYGPVHLAYDYEQRYRREHDFDFNFAAVKPPAYQGYQSPWRIPRVATHPEIVLSGTLAQSDAERIMRMLDWFRTDEGHSTALFGIQGDDWDFLDGGPRQLGTSDNFHAFQAWRQGWNASDFAAALSQKRWQFRDPWVTDNFWSDYAPKYYSIYRPPFPHTEFAPDELEQIIPLLNSLHDAALEWVAGAIDGAVPMDDWGLLQNHLRQLGVDHLEQLFNDAYDRQADTSTRSSAAPIAEGRIPRPPEKRLTGSPDSATKPPPRNNEGNSTTAQASAGASFPWAHGILPSPTTLLVINPGILSPVADTPPTLPEVDAFLTTILDAAGYIERRYFPIPHGYVLVTNMEPYSCTSLHRTRPVWPFRYFGEYIEEKVADVAKFVEWLNQNEAVRRLFLVGVIESFTKQRQLHIDECLRLVMFAVSKGSLETMPYSQTDDVFDRILRELMTAGANTIPDALRDALYDGFTTTILIYQFVTDFAEPGSDPDVTFVDGTSSYKRCAHDHMDGAGLGDLLTTSQRTSVNASC